MAIKLLCVICSRSTEHFTPISYMDADGLTSQKGKYLCDDCKGPRSLRCDLHREQHVVFIDNT